MKRIVILGAGTAGPIMANLLRRRLRREEWAITIVDRDNEHYYQPGFLFIPFGFYTAKDIVKPRPKFIPRGVEFIVSEVDRINPAANEIVFKDKSALPYDFLVVTTGAEIVPSETPGMLDGWRDTIFDFYTPDGASALTAKLKDFPGGRIVIHVNETPIKCPVAPMEFAFFCDWCLRRHHRRDKIDLIYVTPLPGAFTKPVASKALGAMLDEKKVEMVLFQGDLVLKAGERFSPEAIEAYLQAGGPAVSPGLIFAPPPDGGAAATFSPGTYRDAFWPWAAWKNRELLGLADELMAEARGVRPGLRFALNLYYPSRS